MITKITIELIHDMTPEVRKATLALLEQLLREIVPVNCSYEMIVKDK